MYTHVIRSDPNTNSRSTGFGCSDPFRTAKGREAIGTPGGSPLRQSARLRPGEGPNEDLGTWRRAAA